MNANTASVELASGGKGGISGGGLVAQRLMQSGFNVNALRTNDVLRKDEWKLYDTALVTVARTRLVGVGDLLSRGLSMKLPNALGVTRVEWETATEMVPADVTMSGISQSTNDRMEFDLTGIPVPIVHKDFNLNIRHLEASRRTGQPIDTMQIERCTRMVVEKIENILFAGFTGLGSNNTIYGYKNATNRNTGSVSASWVTATGAQIVFDVLAMIGKSVADNMYGPWMLYVPVDAYVHMGDDYKANGDLTILERVKAIPGIIDVRPTSDLAAPNVLLVQMTKDVVDMIDGIQPTMVEWDSHGGFVKNFKVIAIMVPRVRNDSDLQSGVVHYS